MSPSFMFPALIVGLVLVAAPLLIHLINMLRHRRVKWAAMDFLLQSYKRNRNWVWLKQLLLLLLRMAAVALAVLMLAGFGCQNELSEMFAGRETHHYVLLDDSYSAADTSSGESVFDRANKAIRKLADQAGREQHQKFTLIRYSQAGRGDDDSPGQAADINGETIDNRFDVLLEEVARGYEVTQFSTGPQQALKVVEKLMQDDEVNKVYVVSDFRSKEWENPTDIRAAMEAIRDRDGEIQLVSCIKDEHPNLAVLDVIPADKTRAAGVPLPVDVKVKNFGTQPARNVQVKVRSLFFDPTLQENKSPEQMEADVDELPVVVVDEIAPGETVERRVQVFFPLAGQHVIEAWVEDENQKTDDHRYAVVDIPEGVPVLVIDGTGIEQHAYYLRSALDPAARGEDDTRTRANTGIRPEVKNEAFLRDATAEELAKYFAIYLLDVGRLDERAVANLETFVEGGGGLAVFAGEDVDTGFYNDRFYNEGKGLFPLPLEGFAGLEPDLVEGTSDIEIMPHPLLAEFTGERSLMIRMVTIERYLKAKQDWEPEPDSGVSVAARLRGGDPLFVVKKFGEGGGRVVAVLSSVAPNANDSDATAWNTWTRTPAFPMIALELQAYLAEGRREIEPRAVGDTIELELDAARYSGNVKFIAPGDEPDQRVPIEKTAQPVDENSPLLVATIGGGSGSRRSGETDKQGVYEAWLTNATGGVEVRRYAVNVDPLEGEMAIVPAAGLEQKLASVKPKVTSWDVILATPDRPGNGPWAQIFLGILIVLLLGEQLLAYSASYHPLRGAVR